MTASQYNRTPGRLVDASTLVIQRRLPGTPERVWAYLTDSSLRRQWLASGDMPAGKGAAFELVWRNDELSASAEERPDGGRSGRRRVRVGQSMCLASFLEEAVE